MKANILILMVGLLMNYVVGVAFIYLFVLIVRALKKYIKSEPVRKRESRECKVTWRSD